MFETETVGPCLVRKLKWWGEGGGIWPLGPNSDYTLYGHIYHDPQPWSQKQIEILVWFLFSIIAARYNLVVYYGH